MTLRGQYQHAVRAPSVGELFGGVQNFAAATDPCSAGQPVAQQTAAVRAVCIATGVPASQVFGAGVQPNAIIGNLTGGNPQLGVERSDTRTFGVVLTPAALGNLALSIDYFNINLDGAVLALGGGLNSTLNLCYNVIQDSNSPYCQAIRRNPVTGEISPPYYVTLSNANTGGIKTSGIDLEGRDSLSFGPGALELLTDWTWTQEMTYTPVDVLPMVKDYCVGAFGPTCGASPGAQGCVTAHVARGSAECELATSLHRKSNCRFLPDTEASREALPGAGHAGQSGHYGPELFRSVFHVGCARQRPALWGLG